MGAKTIALQANHVFVPGGQPKLTYNPRQNLNLETTLQRYLYTGYKILTITGPTKSGKTVLCKKIIPTESGVWVSGGSIGNETDLWSLIINRLEQFTHMVTEEGQQVKKGTSVEGGASGGLGPVLTVGGKIISQEEKNKIQKIIKSHDITPQVSAVNALKETSLPLIIDDFHYMDTNLQKKLIRALKEPIFEGLKVIVIAVPHRAYDTIRQESEMAGRVMHLEIPLWKEEELIEIPKQGFPALNISASSSMIDHFSKSSFGSPHLMQDFCLNICIQNQTDLVPTKRSYKISPPHDYFLFYRQLAVAAAKPTFDRLSRGPRQRSDRVPRPFIDGRKEDIYVAVLHGVAHAIRSEKGIATQLKSETIRNSLRKILKERIPQTQEVARVLIKMTEIAQSEIGGEPVLEWDSENSLLHIADPFFAFYLMWGVDLPTTKS